MNARDNKQNQLSISQYEESRVKEGKKKLLSHFPIPVLLIFLIPVAILLVTFLSYLFFIRKISAP